MMHDPAGLTVMVDRISMHYGSSRAVRGRALVSNTENALHCLESQGLERLQHSNALQAKRFQLQGKFASTVMMSQLLLGSIEPGS